MLYLVNAPHPSSYNLALISFAALSGLDLERSPSVLSDLVSESDFSQHGSTVRADGSLESISVSGKRIRRRTRKATEAQLSARSSTRKKRKTQSSTISGSSERRHHYANTSLSQVLSSSYGVATSPVDFWSPTLVVKGYPGPYTWPIKQQKADIDLHVSWTCLLAHDRNFPSMLNLLPLS